MSRLPYPLGQQCTVLNPKSRDEKRLDPDSGRYADFFILLIYFIKKKVFVSKTFFLFDFIEDLKYPAYESLKSASA